MNADKNLQPNNGLWKCFTIDGEEGSCFGPLFEEDEEDNEIVPTEKAMGLAIALAEDKTSKGIKAKKQSKFVLKKKTKIGSRMPPALLNEVVNPLQTPNL